MTDPFAAFVADPANQAALAAARTVAEATRVLYGPLVLVGRRGAGKSHLLLAIRDRVAAGTPPRQVELVAIGRLAELLHGRGSGEGGAALRDRLIRADLLLMDDFEAVERHGSVQALIFDVLESRLAAGRDAVIATAMPLARLGGLDTRLLRRLREGTVVELGLPSADARAAILRRRVDESGVALPSAVAAAVAGLELRSVKEYLGALNRVLAYQQASAAPLKPEDALVLIGVEPSGVNGHPAPASRSVEPSLALQSTEFDAFLSEVVANVSLQFDQWRTRLREAVAHWQGQGLRTRRLEQAIAGEAGSDPEPLISEFGRDAGELLRLAAEARVVAPDLAGAEVFRDPDQVLAARELLAEARSRRAPLSAPLADLTLGTLAVGPSNRMALEAVHAVAAAPGMRYNPLVVVGPSGVGKTHLLHSLGNALVARGASPIACLAAHSFLGELSALRTSEELAQWRARYQWVAGLLVDDIHVLAHEPRAQEELLQLHGGLAEGARPMAFTSAKRLTELEGFDPRLLTRLEAGLVAELLPPDREVRLGVVKALLASTAAAQDAALIDYLAARPADSIRSVQGAVQRVLSEADAAKAVPTVALARGALEVVDVKHPRPTRRPAATASGILSPGLGVVRSREKMVLGWPFVGDLLMSDLR